MPGAQRDHFGLNSFALYPVKVELESEAGRIRGFQVAVLDDRRPRKHDHFFQRDAGWRYPLRPFGPHYGRHRVGEVLAVRVVRAGMRDHGESVCLRQMADLDTCGHSTHPLEIWLEDIYEAVARCERERVNSVPVLSGGERLIGNTLA